MIIGDNTLSAKTATCKFPEECFFIDVFILFIFRNCRFCFVRYEGKTNILSSARHIHVFPACIPVKYYESVS